MVQEGDVLFKWPGVAHLMKIKPHAILPVLGQQYQSVSHKKKRGRFYTPSFVIHKIGTIISM